MSGERFRFCTEAMVRGAACRSEAVRERLRAHLPGGHDSLS
jgi:hypothetical protein